MASEVDELRMAAAARESRGLISGLETGQARGYEHGHRHGDGSGGRSPIDVGLEALRNIGGHRVGRGGGDGGDFFGNLRRNSSCMGLVALVALIFLLVSWDALEPTQFGLVYNTYTGYVNMKTAYGGGRHILGPGKRFIIFPASAVTIEFGTTTTSTTPPVDARTGRDASDPDSGGQPVRLHFAFQYQLRKGTLGMVYKSFSTQYEDRYIQFARQAVSDVAQSYNPIEFWMERGRIALDMEAAVRRAIEEDGGASIVSLQLLRVDFSSKYEDTIVGIQLAVQNKTTNEYRQQVVMVLKSVDIGQTETEAQCTAISARATANATVIKNNATSWGFNHVQNTKALSYARLGSELALSKEDLVRYIRLKSIRTHDPSSLVVGVEGGWQDSPLGSNGQH